MDVLVDDHPYQTTGSPDQTVRELAQEVCDAGHDHGQRIVVSLRCDGNEVGQEGLDAILMLPTSQFQRLELHTQSVAALVQSTIAQAIELFENANQSRAKIADLLGEGQSNEAMQQLQKLLSAWQQLQQTTWVCAQTLNINLDTLQTDNLALNDIMESLKTQLNELKASLENRDFVLVADILRYELEQPLAHWLAILKDLQKQA